MLSPLDIQRVDSDRGLFVTIFSLANTLNAGCSANDLIDTDVFGTSGPGVTKAFILNFAPNRN